MVREALSQQERAHGRKTFIGRVGLRAIRETDVAGDAHVRLSRECDKGGQWPAGKLSDPIVIVGTPRVKPRAVKRPKPSTRSAGSMIGEGGTKTFDLTRTDRPYSRPFTKSFARAFFQSFE
jgi:hypothetical protein